MSSTLRGPVLARALARVLVAALAALVLAPAAAAADRLEPEDLPRGPDIAVPHVDGRTLVDGERRVRLPAGQLQLLGRSGRSFVLASASQDGVGRKRLLRVRPDDSITVLKRGGDVWETQLSRDGRHLVLARGLRGQRTRLSVWSARTGALLHRHELRGYVDVLDTDAGRSVVTDFRSGTAWLDLRTGRRAPLTKRPSHGADIRADRLAGFTGDPYRGRCTIVSPLRRPGRVLWRSCRERVDTFAPDGRTMATIDLLSDGIGPPVVWIRSVRGTLHARHRATGWFGLFWWESPTALLLDVNGKERSATVRCGFDTCENATDLREAPDL